MQARSDRNRAANNAVQTKLRRHLQFGFHTQYATAQALDAAVGSEFKMVKQKRKYLKNKQFSIPEMLEKCKSFC